MKELGIGLMIISLIILLFFYLSNTIGINPPTAAAGTLLSVGIYLFTYKDSIYSE